MEGPKNSLAGFKTYLLPIMRIFALSVNFGFGCINIIVTSFPIQSIRGDVKS